MEVKFVSSGSKWSHTLYELQGFVPRIGERVIINGHSEKVSMVQTDITNKLITVYLVDD